MKAPIDDPGAAPAVKVADSRESRCGFMRLGLTTGVDVAGGALRVARFVEKVAAAPRRRHRTWRRAHSCCYDETIGAGLPVASHPGGFRVAILRQKYGPAVEFVDVHGDALGPLGGDSGPLLARRSASARRRRTAPASGFLADDSGVQGFGLGVRNEGHRNARGVGTRHQRYHEDAWLFTNRDCSGYERVRCDA
jgi:hypothetical protein